MSKANGSAAARVAVQEYSDDQPRGDDGRWEFAGGLEKARQAEEQHGIKPGDKVKVPGDKRVHNVLSVAGTRITAHPEGSSDIQDFHATKVTKVTKAKESALPASQSLDALREKVNDALRDKYSAAGDGDGSSAVDSMPWVRDLFQDRVVYALDGDLYQASYSLDQASGEVTIGEPQKVEISYTPVGESSRVMAREAAALAGGGYDATKGKLIVRVIQPGLSKNNFLYPADVLKRDHKVFEGAKMFADHQTEDEADQRPEGSVNKWVGVLESTWANEDGTIMGSATVVDPPFKAKLDRLAESNLLHEMGVSIRAVAEGRPAEAAGRRAVAIERLVASRSVDFVTYAGAGGRVVALEARADDTDVDLVDEAQLRARRPDLVAAIESHARTEVTTMEADKQKIADLEQQLKQAQESAAAANERATKAEGEQKRAAAKAELTRLLSESSLPDAAKKRIEAQYETAESSDGMAEAIKAEADYIATIAESAGVRNMGDGHNRTDDGGAKVNLTEAFKKLGLPEKEAIIAGGARR